MGRLIARELDNMKWGFYSCLLFIGISSPAFHQFYKNSNSIVFKGGLHHEKSLKIISALAASAIIIGAFAGCGGEKKDAPKAADAGNKTAVKLVVSSTERPIAWQDEDGKSRDLNMIYGRK